MSDPKNLRHGPKALRVLRHRQRLVSSALVAIAVFAALLPFVRTSQAILIGFDCGALIFLVAMSRLVSRSTPKQMRERARLHAEGRSAVLVFSMVVTGVVVLALYIELHAKGSPIVDVVLSGFSILLSWLFLAAVFAEQYAHSFYLSEAAGGGLRFPGTDTPDYWDFVYFSVVLSMTFQVSDVQITGRALRHIALFHSIVAFFFNVIIIAISVNIVANTN